MSSTFLFFRFYIELESVSVDYNVERWERAMRHDVYSVFRKLALFSQKKHYICTFNMKASNEA